MTVALAPFVVDLPEVEERPRMPGGFRAAAVAAGIKPSGGLDLGVLTTTDGPASVAGTFTTNRLPAAPVRLSRANLERSGGRTCAVLSTSGCANAATGPTGDRDQAALGERLADRLGVSPELTLAVATGLIGSRLPVDALRGWLDRLVPGALLPGDHGLASLAEQFRTTDTRSKTASLRIELPGPDGRDRGVIVSGVAKGVGMIHPRMATMLALLLTDATVEPAVLQTMLGPIVDRTWNQLTVDGDTSTNDTVFLLASGAAGTAPIEAGGPAGQALARALEAVARSLARQQAADGEGATTLITCQVTGGRDTVDARAAARAVVASSLVKAAVYGRDPNWGRIAAALGNARSDTGPVLIEPDRLAIAIAGVAVFAGEPLPHDRASLAARMDAPEVVIRVDLGQGDAAAEAFGCDLTERYVVENSAYTT